MAYTIGTAHGPFTGAGSFVVAKPNGLRLVSTGLPGHTSHDGGDPRRYFRWGRIVLGNIHGFSDSLQLEYLQHLFYPLPPVWELVAYDLKSGVSTTFYELVDVPDLTVKQPWDRTPSTVSLWNVGTLPNAAVSWQLWTYTVPANRRLVLAHAEIGFHRRSLATTPLLTGLNMYVAGNVMLECEKLMNAVGMTDRATLGGGGLMVAPGVTIVVIGYDSSATGSVQAWASLQGYLFDA